MGLPDDGCGRAAVSPRRANGRVRSSGGTVVIATSKRFPLSGISACCLRERGGINRTPDGDGWLLASVYADDNECAPRHL